MNLNDLVIKLESLGMVDTDPVLIYDDGCTYEVADVEHVDGVVRIVVGPDRDYRAPGDGDSERQETRQDGLQRTIADKAGLSDLHRP